MVTISLVVGWLLELVPVETCDILSLKNRRHIIISARNTVEMLSNTSPGTVSARLAQLVSRNNVRHVPTIPTIPCVPFVAFADRRALNITIPSLISVLATNRGYKYDRKIAWKISRVL